MTVSEAGRRRGFRVGVAVCAVCFGMTLASAAPARGAEHITLTVVVTDTQTAQPINQAQLTLQFHEPGKIRHKLISYTAKTNMQGRCKFVEIPAGTVHLIVTHAGHQTFGRDFEIDSAHAELDVKLKPPHPQL